MSQVSFICIHMDAMDRRSWHNVLSMHLEKLTGAIRPASCG